MLIGAACIAVDGCINLSREWGNRRELPKQKYFRQADAGIQKSLQIGQP